MKPAKLNLIIYQGSTFIKGFSWQTGDPAQPVNLTGYTARMQIRTKVTDIDVLLELTTENDRIIITDPINGKFELYISSNDTTNLQFKSAVYDLELISPSGIVTTRILEGNVTLSFEVTR